MYGFAIHVKVLVTRPLYALTKISRALSSLSVWTRKQGMKQRRNFMMSLLSGRKMAIPLKEEQLKPLQQEQRRQQIQPTAEPACLRAVDGVQAALCSQHEDRVECR